MRAPRRPVVISIDGHDAGLQVEVDRGVATYVQPIAAEEEGLSLGGAAGPEVVRMSRWPRSHRRRSRSATTNRSSVGCGGLSLSEDNRS